MSKTPSNNKLIREFISQENRNYRLQLGTTLASSLTGIVVGIVLASIVWFIALDYIVEALKLVYAG